MKNAYNTSAYGSFAYVYDIFMDNVNYREWTEYIAVSYTHLTLPTNVSMCRSRWSPYH